MRWDDVVQLVEDLPDVVVGASYGTPALKVKAKLLTRLRTEDNSLVLLDVAPDERDMLMEANPVTFHTTPHYGGYPIVLARLGTLEPASVRMFLERRWRNVASKRTVAQWDLMRQGFHAGP